MRNISKRFPGAKRKSSRVFGDIKLQDTPRSCARMTKTIQHSERYRRNREEVDGDHLANVISEKRRPGLRRLSRLLRHEARHGPFGNLKSQLFQFTVYAWRSHVGLA